MFNTFLWVLITSLLCQRVICDELNLSSTWENVNLNRIIDLSRSYTREKLQITVKNIGNKPSSIYYLAYPNEIISKTALITASLGDSQFIDAALVKDTTTLEDGSIIGYGAVSFPKSVEPGEDFSFEVSIEYNSCGEPYPKHIDIFEEQHLLFRTGRYPLSAYFTKEFTLKFLGSTSYKELNEPQDTNLHGTAEDIAYSYGPFNNIDSYYKNDVIELVYLHNIPLNKVVNLQRDIWVSHWAGSLQFEEYYELVNSGAKLNKGFSRLDHMKKQRQTLHGHYRGVIDTVLPSGAFDHYYTDLVGMVSTYQVNDDHFYLKPRYPIYGGWKYNFTIGWTNVLSDFLRTTEEKDTYILSVPILNGPPDTTYDNTSVSIYLMEGTVVEEVDVPVPYASVQIDTKHSYFDLNKGHVKVTFNFENLVDELRSGRILVKYRYDSTAFYKKPISIASYIFIALISFFTLAHINLNIDNKQK
ncbi:hypothetical protein Kpol_2002p107 [Vanderwaltozyma polyspora DSM 70294]|uniref:Dolichyl-diphosphooligosaccharide--protein glycosyltransferase subunit 1 n=1 Tax=Vanderwaltozyma polyspora (strain ATCC 22028 / DSM 70294 / BCRC 21397 / CBS 2163 / NBRC 10782 / NRRL Y-8283 / UCD 57-17) TaxID=436907 RepID=A7TFM0_VANPO|nr:uncharacterized protein Kpol_2002p107 [Vanderwaltozyma polyspora DSM 70294]EDO19034.1 hypothetical protein Kpol_2002p107 [Vanderwaltozyma polyspora DSM 70294]